MSKPQSFNDHPFMITWTCNLTSYPAIETFETLDKALTTLKDWRERYPDNLYFLYHSTPTPEAQVNEH